ncbi:GNAT family N-acetyltransferase [Vineibacter terrae]|uniref:GNAT family N-acetyltransferase n=1 Tax=Vineibacter terrae TaxID=2586908 RepID=A0A5C8PFA4_9HYPH|nr:GNAT family N-acetyltransferase [Vineibacter terrae]TXL72192.1 GNAT family N-acetyltransferase [Vineibacter terrae]
MPGITIRRLMAADAADYRAIRLEALQRAPQAFGSTYVAEAARPVAAFAERLTGSVVFGAYAAAGIVGMAGLARSPGPKESHKGFLWGMYVRAEMRGQGVGALLVEAVIAAAAATLDQITLSVVQENAAARALYERFGFTAYGVEPRALKTPDGYVDEVLMVKFLRRPEGSS